MEANRNAPLSVTEGEEVLEKAVLVSVDTGEFDTDISLEELGELAATAGAQVLGTLVQKRESPDKATCLGSGRLAELRELCENAGGGSGDFRPGADRHPT